MEFNSVVEIVFVAGSNPNGLLQVVCVSIRYGGLACTVGLSSERKTEWGQELEKICVLGEGASAVSYLCMWTASTGVKKQVVVKQYKHSFTEAASNRLWREVDVLESIRHERIPTYIGHYITEQDGRRLLCLIVDYIEGKSLADAMKTYRWTLHESLQIIHQLLQIVAYLQSLQPSILHRDIVK